MVWRVAEVEVKHHGMVYLTYKYVVSLVVTSSNLQRAILTIYVNDFSQKVKPEVSLEHVNVGASSQYARQSVLNTSCILKHQSWYAVKSR